MGHPRGAAHSLQSLQQAAEAAQLGVPLEPHTGSGSTLEKANSAH